MVVLDDGSVDSSSMIPDCAGVKNGTAYKDTCGRCVGGTTGKVECKDTTAIQPCDSLKKVSNKLDSIFIKSKADSILNTIQGLDTLSVEKGFAIFQKFSVNPFPPRDTIFQNSFKTSDIKTGTSNGINYSVIIPSFHVDVADLHTHPLSGYNAQSSHDIYILIEHRLNNKYYNTKFVASSNGNKYAISIVDKTQAATFLSTKSQYLNDSTNLWQEDSEIGKAYEKAYDYFENGDVTKKNYAYEMAMAAVLKQFKTGVSLNKKDEAGNFKPIVVNTITHPEKPKKKFYIKDCL